MYSVAVDLTFARGTRCGGVPLLGGVLPSARAAPDSRGRLQSAQAAASPVVAREFAGGLERGSASWQAGWDWIAEQRQREGRS